MIVLLPLIIYVVSQFQYACPSCGFGYCNKCLKLKTIVPNKSKSEQHVCKTCHARITTGRREERPPPDAMLRRLEALENPAAPPITIYRPADVQRAALSEEDKIIAQRLAQLRSEQALPPISDSDIQRRLAKLKGVNFYSETPVRGVRIKIMLQFSLCSFLLIENFARVYWYSFNV